MTKNKIITFTLVIFTILFFLGITTFAIIISRGGLITKEGIVETSVIKIEVEPNVDVTVFVDGEERKLQDNRINQLQEGTYNIVIDSDGYARWEKDVEVNLGIVTNLNVRLYPATFELEQVTQTNIDRVYFSEDGQYAYYVVSTSDDGSDNGIWRLKLTTGAFIFGNQNPEPEMLVNIGPLLTPIIESNQYEILVSSDNSKFILQDLDNKENYIFSSNEFNNEPEYILNDILGIVPDSVNWFEGSNSVVVKDENLLFEFQLNNSEKTIIILGITEDTTYTISDSHIYFTSESGGLMLYSSNTPEIVETIAKIIPEDINQIYISKYDHKKVIFKTAQSYIYVDFNSEFSKEIVSADHNIVAFSPDGNSALFQKENLVSSFNVKEIIATGKIETSFIDTGIVLKEADFISYSPQSVSIIYYDSETNTLSFTEPDGKNRINALSELELTRQTYSVNSNGAKFYIALEDEIETIESSKSTNLYRIDLESSN